MSAFASRRKMISSGITRTFNHEDTKHERKSATESLSHRDARRARRAEHAAVLLGSVTPCLCGLFAFLVCPLAGLKACATWCPWCPSWRTSASGADIDPCLDVRL